MFGGYQTLSPDVLLASKEPITPGMKMTGIG